MNGEWRLGRDGRHPVTGHWPSQKTWYSICSRHYVHDEECGACNSGWWYSDFTRFVSSAAWKTSPRLWRFLANSRIFSKYVIGEMADNAHGTPPSSLRKKAVDTP